MEVDQEYDAILLQSSLAQSLQNLWSNFKKDSKQRKTLEYRKAKLEKLDLYWTVFDKNHQLLLENPDKSHDYFVENHYKETKQFYHDVRKSILQTEQYTTKIVQPPKLVFQSPAAGGDAQAGVACPVATTQPIVQPSMMVHQTPATQGDAQAGVTSQAAVSGHPPATITPMQTPHKILEDLLRKQESNFKAFSQTISEILLSDLSKKWDFDEALKNLESCWKVVDSLHCEINLENSGKIDTTYEKRFTEYETRYKDFKKSLGGRMQSVSHIEHSTPKLDNPIFNGNYQQLQSRKQLSTMNRNGNKRLDGYSIKDYRRRVGILRNKSRNKIVMKSSEDMLRAKIKALMKIEKETDSYTDNNETPVEKIIIEHSYANVKIEKEKKDVGDTLLGTDETETEPAECEEDPSKMMYADHEIKEEEIVIGPVVLSDNVPTQTLVEKELRDEVNIKIGNNLEDFSIEKKKAEDMLQHNNEELIKKDYVTDGIYIPTKTFKVPSFIINGVRGKIMTAQNEKFKLVIDIEDDEVDLVEKGVRYEILSAHDEIKVKVEKESENVGDTLLGKDVIEPSEGKEDLTKELYADHEIKEEEGMVIGPTISERFECGLSSEVHFTNQCLQPDMQQSHTGLKNYECESCKKQFITELMYEYHIKKYHTADKPFTCDVCEKRLSNKYSLTVHKKLHGDDTFFACDVCDKRFPTIDILTWHMKLHSTVKPFNTCDVCGKIFVKRSFTSHKKLHSTDYKRIVCDYCYKNFCNKHKKLRSNDKPFACDVCDKRFGVKKSLAEHKKIHSTNKLFTCGVCDKGYAFKRSLTRHMEIHRAE